MKNAVIVTGASRGIGRALALAFARRGHALVLAARSAAELEQVAREAGVETRVVVCDLGDVEGRAQLVAAVGPDELVGLVNNAGFGTAGEFLSLDAARERQLVRLNCEAPVDLLHALASRLPRGGFVINVASTAAFQPVPLFATYAASKAFLLSLSEALSEELAPRGVHVLALCPGVTESGFQKEANVVAVDAVTPEEVARYALQALDARKRVAVHGVFNALRAFSVRLGPRALVAKVAKKTMQPWFSGR